jgi:hypothetical protein
VRVRCNIGFDVTEEELGYLDSCSRIRGVTRARLLTRIITAVARDMLVESVLDDSSNLTGLRKGERRRRKFADKDAP